MIIYRKGLSVIKLAFAAVILTVATADDGLENHRSARKLSFGESCTAALRITDDDDDKNTNETLDCETADGQLYPLRTPGSFVADKMQDGSLVPGVTKIKLSNGYLDLDSGVVSSESIKLLNPDSETKVDSSVTGTKTMLMVRVIAKDSTTTGNKSQLAASILANKRQLLGCSHDRFTINPAANDDGLSTVIRNGVVEISLPNTSKSIGNSMVGVITTEIKRQFGVSSPSALANYVMYCLPKGTIGRSYAYLNHWQSVMNDNSCLHPGTWIHELGHNLNLHHSNEGNQEYMDTTGLMGNYWYGDDEKMCFNGPKSWQLGWYKERHLEISNSRPRYQGFLSSVLANPANDGPPIIIKVGHYYLTFNAATGMTAGTGEAKNQVTVTKQTRDGYKSFLVAKLGASGTYTISDMQPNCKVTVSSVQTTTAIVSVQLLGSTSAPTLSPAPTLAPTSPAPTKTPPENLAKGKPTKQSSTYPGGDSRKAVDGNTDGRWGSRSVTHTHSNRQAWWEVDLEKAFSIDTVVLYNRSDCCSERLSNFKVIIMHKGKEAYLFHYTARAPQKTTFSPPKSITGDKVKVQLQGTGILSLAEVEVYGQSTAVKKCSTNGKKCLSVEKLSFSSSEDDFLKVKFDFRPMMKWQKNTKQVVVVKGGEKPNNSNTYGVKNVRRRKQTLLFDLASLVSKMPGGVGPLDIYFVKKGTVVYPETMISVNVSA